MRCSICLLTELGVFFFLPFSRYDENREGRDSQPALPETSSNLCTSFMSPLLPASCESPEAGGSLPLFSDPKSFQNTGRKKPPFSVGMWRLWRARGNIGSVLQKKGWWLQGESSRTSAASQGHVGSDSIRHGGRWRLSFQHFHWEEGGARGKLHSDFVIPFCFDFCAKPSQNRMKKDTVK